ncbi:uncharacterized protein BDZ83DRAFT_186593 [Colletotrichum acutatum]|uniref:Uncharacterized protein n=1 Tax=Glomerella acutata TaxID=27357 RepID=A0AAD8XIH1_GLOAC|nr:uncharacterized protein BDZ83DRAFT_186593 [Colletotrichum acutatum]KAK1727696.1 hypothetical protein BDZ83DRAFT_186593 [Colletotrichum acutatum]
MQNDEILVASETRTFRSSEEQTTGHEPGRQLTKLGPGVANSIFDSDGRSWRRRKFSPAPRRRTRTACLGTAGHSGRWEMVDGSWPSVSRLELHRDNVTMWTGKWHGGRGSRSVTLWGPDYQVPTSKTSNNSGTAWRDNVAHNGPFQGYCVDPILPPKRRHIDPIPLIFGSPEYRLPQCGCTTETRDWREAVSKSRSSTKGGTKGLSADSLLVGASTCSWLKSGLRQELRGMRPLSRPTYCRSDSLLSPPLPSFRPDSLATEPDTRLSTTERCHY